MRERYEFAHDSRVMQKTSGKPGSFLQREQMKTRSRVVMREQHKADNAALAARDAT